MKSYFIFSIIVFLTGCLRSDKVTQEIQAFDAFMGESKAYALDQAMNSFHLFLATNYPNQGNISDQTKAYLTDINSHGYIYMLNLKYDIDDIKSVVRAFEETGLRKDIYLYLHEEYSNFDFNELDLRDILPENSTPKEIDSNQLLIDEFLISDAISEQEFNKQFEREQQHNRGDNLYFNVGGKFLYALAKFNKTDTTVMELVDIKLDVGDISFTLLSGGILYKNPSELDRPWLQRAILAEIYFYFIYKKLQGNQ